jgi:hypothetical protein
MWRVSVKEREERHTERRGAKETKTKTWQALLEIRVLVDGHLLILLQALSTGTLRGQFGEVVHTHSLRSVGQREPFQLDPAPLPSLRRARRERRLSDPASPLPPEPPSFLGGRDEGVAPHGLEEGICGALALGGLD